MAELAAPFMVIRQYGPPYDPAKPLEAQLEWEQHRVFMNALEAEGAACLAGPLGNGIEVLLICRGSSAAAVEQRLSADPWTRSGILTTTRIDSWTVRLGQLAEPAAQSGA